jgi:hypothetical protein
MFTATETIVWKFFLAACLLTAAILQPHAPVVSIVAGMGLAGLLLWAHGRVSRHRVPGDSKDHSRPYETDR